MGGSHCCFPTQYSSPSFLLILPVLFGSALCLAILLTSHDTLVARGGHGTLFGNRSAGGTCEIAFMKCLRLSQHPPLGFAFFPFSFLLPGMSIWCLKMWQPYCTIGKRVTPEGWQSKPIEGALSALDGPQTPLHDKDPPLAYTGHHLLGFCYMQQKWFITGVHLLRKLYRKEDKREQYPEKRWGITEGSGRSIQSRAWLGMMKWMQKTWRDDSNWRKGSIQERMSLC